MSDQNGHNGALSLQAAGLDTVELQAVTGMDREAVMQRLICREWLTALEAADRRDHYWLLPDVVFEFDSVRNHEAISRT